MKESSSPFSPRKALLLLPPLLIAAFALQWPPKFGIQFQSPFILEHINHNEISLSTNPVDGQVHLPNGKHYMLDFQGVDNADLTFLETPEGEAAVTQEIINSGMTFLGSRSHLFPGGGLTAVFLLSESHMSIHTWPEHSFVALDIYTCGNSMAADRLVESMSRLLKPHAAKVSYIERGSDLSHSVQVNRVAGTEKVEKKGTVSRPGTTANPIFLNTQRPDPLVLPATVDICVNAAFDGEECILWRNASLLYSQKSEVQLVEVVDRQFGERCLLLDGITQFCDSPDNEWYTQSLTERVMQPLISPTHSRTGEVDIYIVGGGDGWISTHLLSAYSSLIRSIRVIDIDPMVSDVTREFFPIDSGADSFKDSRVQYIAGDAAIWLRNAQDMSADAMIIDCTDHTVESASLLYTDSFYSDVLRVLRPGGRFSQQMNTKDKRFETFQKQAKESWLKLGFTDVMEWQEYIVNYGGIIVMMGGIKGKD
ncbi:S-adenosyl-L-methionine-dependent methyltransferase [Phlegmacium glaucopus]|nr:S-adenosyl-L-methionine-dependent methyltransferase [Phlegmacium glaucopus]